MVKIGFVDVDESQYPDLKLKEYMQCQSKAFMFATFNCFTGGGVGYIVTRFIPKIYPLYNKKYNLIVMAGGAIVTSYLVANHMTKQCQRQFLMTGSKRSSLPAQRPYSQKVEDAETMLVRVDVPNQKAVDAETIHELHKGVGKRV